MAAGSWIEQALNFLTFVILARLLGAEIIGLAAMAVAFIVLASALVRETFTEHLIAHQNPDQEDHNAVFWCLMLLGGTLTVLIFALAGPISGFYGEPEVANFLRVLTLVVLMISVTAVPVAILRRDMRFDVLSIRAISGVVVGGIIGIAMALTGYGVWSLIIQFLALTATNAIIAWVKAGWSPGRPPPLSKISEVARFGFKVIGVRTGELTATQAPLVMVGGTLGAAALGQFFFAWRLIEIGSFLVVTPLRMTSQSAFSAITRAGQAASDLLDNLFGIIGLLSLPAFAGLAMLSPYLIPVLFGAGWEDAIPVVQIMCAAGVFFSFEKVQQAFSLAAGKAGQYALVTWAEALLGVILIWAFASKGIWIVAIIFSLRYYLLWPMRFAIVQTIGGGTITEFARKNVLPLIATVMMSAVIYGVTLMQFQPVLTLLAGTCIGILTFGLLSFILMRDRIESALKLARGETRQMLS